MRKWIVAAIVILAVVLQSCEKMDLRNSEQQLTHMRNSRVINKSQINHWLKHSNPNIRLKAVETLGIVQDAESAALLEQCLFDPDTSIQAATIFALGQMFDPASEELLLRALFHQQRRDNYFRVYEALGKSGSEVAATKVGEFLKFRDIGIRKAATKALADMALRNIFPEEYPYLLHQILREDDPETSWRAAYALYRMGALRSFADYDFAITAKFPLTRYYGLKGIQRIIQLSRSPRFQELKNEPDYAPFYKRIASRQFRDTVANLLNDPERYNRIAALQVFELLKDDNYLNRLTPLIEDEHPQIRLAALHSVRSIKNRTTERLFEKMATSHEDWRIKGESLIALATIAPAKAMKMIRNEAIQFPWPQSYYTIVALDSMKSANPAKPIPEESEATQLLVQLAEGEPIGQSTVALEALIGRNTPPSIDYFMKKMQEGDVAQTTIIANYIALMDDPRPAQTVQPLMDMFAKFEAPQDLEAMVAIVVALDSLHAKDAESFFEERLTSPHVPIRSAAIKALFTLTGNENRKLPPVDAVSGLRTDFKPLSPDTLYRVRIQTDAGEFTIELDQHNAPVTTANFVHLINSGYYDGILFHRVVPAFVTQIGDPRGDGWGGPGYAIPCEYNDTPYERGTVGMALAGKDTGGSQWFISHMQQPHLNGKYTVFGKIIDGIDAVERIQKFDAIDTIGIIKQPNTTQIQP